MTRSGIPEFFAYGEPERPVEIGFVHVERVRDRNNVHRGRVTPHKHGRLGQITLWTSGAGTYRIEDKSWDFASPAVSFVPSSVVHGFEIGADADAIVVSIADDLVRELEHRTQLGLHQPRFIAGAASQGWERLRSLMDMALTEYQAQPDTSDALLSNLVAAALSLIGRLDVGTALSVADRDLALVLALRRLIDHRFRQPWTHSQLVDELGTTRHLLDKATRNILGKTAKDVLAERRLLEAKRLLLFTIRSVEDIGYEIGFSDAAYFSRFFRLQTGDAPTHWRETQTQRRAR